MEPEAPEAFDSHFHLDRLRKQLSLRRSLTFQQTLAAMDPVEPRVRVVGAVANYCDRWSFPDDSELAANQEMNVTIGIHPKHASIISEGDIRALRRLLQHPRVSGLGEVGLDHSISWDKWHHQMNLLETVLPFLRENQVLVLHCRGMPNDSGNEAFLLLLALLQKQGVPATQKIHLHCFTGTRLVLKTWTDSYPGTYFGVTRTAVHFDEEQKAALREVAADKLLLETDAPYFPVPGQSASAPNHLGATAGVVVKIRGGSVEQLLRTTVQNARQCYTRT